MQKMLELKFNAKGLIPAIVQEGKTCKVLMMAWMNADSLELTRKTGLTHFYSRSRGKLWKKGEESGNIQKVKKLEYDCDGDTLLVTVEPSGPACHTGNKTCFFREIADTDEVAPAKVGDGEEILLRLYQTILQRKRELPEGSYVASLFKKGENAFLKKIGEEAVEFVMAYKNDSKDEMVYESADLIFHMMVTLADKEVSPEEVLAELKKRFK